jgi:fatty acid desaturase
MSKVINILYVAGAVIAAIYLAPFLIALIASGLIQLIIGIAFVYLLFKIVQNANTRDLDRY